jgi:hypothetical protein
VQSIVENDYLNGEVIRLDGALRFPPKCSPGSHPPQHYLKWATRVDSLKMPV